MSESNLALRVTSLVAAASVVLAIFNAVPMPTDSLPDVHAARVMQAGRAVTVAMADADAFVVSAAAAVR